MKFQKTFILILCLLIISSCATFKAQYAKHVKQNKTPTDKEIVHSFYLIGDAGNSELGEQSKALKAFKTLLSKASKNSTAVFLGDNIYEDGLPKESSKDYELAKHRLQIQIDATNDFKGNTVFIPGNHDWYSGIDALKNQEIMVEKALGKHSFLPENGCPIDKIHISKDIELILIDTHWYVTNWNNKPSINDDCDFKTRHDFLEEFGSLVKKARGKTTIVALHHPMYTNGSHGGQFTFKSHLSPLPVLGTLKNVIRKTSGVANVDLQNKRYNELRRRLVTLAQNNKKVVFVSGHEHSLQYIVEDNVRQIVSGSGSKMSGVRNVGGGQFGYGTEGYARLDVFKDGSSNVQFYSVTDDEIVFETEVFSPNTKAEITNYPNQFPETVAASVYTEEETKARGFKKFLWGERYRDVYSHKIHAATVNIDTLFGGLTPVRKGGGNQSKSLRLQDKNGAQYVMRALRKQALQYLQAVLFKDQYIEGQFDDTATEKLILDVFTGSHPYAPFVIGDLSDAVNIYHTNPKLYYVPKQNGLGQYNDEFGDELYMIEEHTSEGHSDKASFGFKDTLISTEDMLKKIHKDEDIVIDETAYVKARLFDMLIGDWDRHQDQWRWIEFKEDGKKVYRPMPRDRDQAFSIMGDGFLLGTAVKLIPTARLLRKYSDDLEDVKGVNVEPYPLDLELIQEADKTLWDSQVKLIQENITDAVIEKAFLNIPEEVRDETIEEIKRTLKARKGNLQKISDRYFELINRFAVIKGTNKDDYFTIECLDNDEVKIVGQRIKKGEKAETFHERIYNRNHTKEIWIYGLDDDDVFEAIGKNSKIKIRLIGGQNNDKYIIPQGGKIVIYDYKSKTNDVSQAKKAKIKLRDDYNSNVYDYKKIKNNTTQIIPSLGFNPDDGFRIGASGVLTNYGFETNPFTSQHTISALYYFATGGVDFDYHGEFANLFNAVNFGLELHYNSPNYAVNFFGFGNSTPNLEADDDEDLDFNRVKIRTVKAMPSLIWRGQYGGKFKIGVSYESNEVERSSDRFIAGLPANNPLFDKQDFYGIDAIYNFVNKDNDAFPTLGLQTTIQVGYKNNTDTNKGFAYILPELGIDYKLIPSGQLVLATDLRAHINFGDDFEFYQAATIGASNGLRGYRNQRFTGKTAFVQSTDLRWNFRKLKTGLMPISLGVYGGVDYGKVWVDDALVFDSNSNNINDWNTSFGGGVFANLANMATANISAFNSDDGLRLAFKLGFGF